MSLRFTEIFGPKMNGGAGTLSVNMVHFPLEMSYFPKYTKAV